MGLSVCVEKSALSPKTLRIGVSTTSEILKAAA